MQNNIKKMWDIIEEQASNNRIRTDKFLILADMYDESGDDKLADSIRWMANNEVYPHHENEYKWTNSDMSIHQQGSNFSFRKSDGTFPWDLTPRVLNILANDLPNANVIRFYDVAQIMFPTFKEAYMALANYIKNTGNTKISFGRDTEVTLPNDMLNKIRPAIGFYKNAFNIEALYNIKNNTNTLASVYMNNFKNAANLLAFYLPKFNRHMEEKIPGLDLKTAINKIAVDSKDALQVLDCNTYPDLCEDLRAIIDEVKVLEFTSSWIM